MAKQKSNAVYLEKSIFNRQEYNTWEDACRKYNVECILVDREFIRSSMQEIQHGGPQYLWSSIETNKVAPFIGSSVNWNIFTDVFPRKYIPNELFLNTCPEYVEAFEAKDDNREMFVRSIVGDKSLSGSVGRVSDIVKECLRDDEWIAISPIKDIGEEFRFIVHDNQVISGAMYITPEEKIVQPYQYKDYRLEDSDPAMLYAKSICPLLYDFSRVAGLTYTMDLTYDRISKSYKIIEFNSFWTAGIYGNSVDGIVQWIANRP